MKGVSNMVGRLTVDETRCTGCMGCVLACSFAKDGADHRRHPVGRGALRWLQTLC